MNTKNVSGNESRLIEDIIGATVGAATGASISTIIGFAVPIVSIVPLGLMIGSATGFVIAELTARKHRLEHQNKNDKPDV